jgi:hypothetical protein
MMLSLAIDHLQTTKNKATELGVGRALRDDRPRRQCDAAQQMPKS